MVTEGTVVSLGLPGDSHRIARVALFGLVSALPGARFTPTGYLLLPDVSPVTKDQALEWLTKLAKPAVCVATRCQEGVALACWPRDVLPGYSIAFRRAEAAERTLSHLREDAGTRDVRVVVDGTNPRLELAGAELQRFMTDYCLLQVASGLRPAGHARGKHRVDAVLDLRSSEGSSVSVLTDTSP
jgi:hypothetical protein